MITAVVPVKQDNQNSPTVTISNATTVVLTACQPIMFGNDPTEKPKKDDSVAIAAAGTELSQGPSQVGSVAPGVAPARQSAELKEGKMVVAAGKGGFLVSTSKGVNVTLPENSTAIVERNRNGQVVVTSLTGPAAQIAIGTDRNTAKVMEAKPGEELAVADDEILIPADAGDQSLTIEATLVVANKNVQRRHFSIEKRMDRERILVCAQGGSMTELNDRLRKKVQQLRNAHAEAPAGKEDKDHLAPVAYITPAAPQVGILRSQKTDTATLRYLSDKTNEFEVSPQQITIKNGEFLVSAFRPTNVLVSGQKFSIDAGGVVLFNRAKFGTEVSDICESKLFSVHGTVYNQSLRLRAGEQLVYDFNGPIVHVLQQDSVARRRLVDFTSTDRHVPMATSEFSYASILSADSLLTKLWRNDRPEDQALFGKIMKVGTVVNLVTVRRGPYSKVNEYSD